MSDVTDTLRASSRALQATLSGYKEQMTLLRQIETIIAELRAENAELKQRLTNTEASLPWHTSREHNLAHDALGQVYRLRIGPNGDYPEIGVVEVMAARAALVAAYADCNALRDELRRRTANWRTV